MNQNGKQGGWLIFLRTREHTSQGTVIVKKSLIENIAVVRLKQELVSIKPNTINQWDNTGLIEKQKKKYNKKILLKGQIPESNARH